MSIITTDRLDRPYSASSHDGREQRRSLVRRSASAGPSSQWLIAGGVVIGLGALAIYYLGPDLLRYIKIERM